MAFDLIAPTMGESVTSARIARWLKHEGEPVTTGDPLVELETDKVNLEVSAPHSGTLAAIVEAEGHEVHPGTVLGRIEAGAETATAPAAPPTGSPTGGPTAPSPPADAPPAAPDAPAPTREPTAVPAPAPAAVAPAPRSVTPPPTVMAPSALPHGATGRSEERVRLSRRRATIARRLVEAQHEAALLTTFNEVDMTAVLALRTRAAADVRGRAGVKIGFMPFFVRAAIAALRRHPRLNAELQGDEVVLKHYYGLGIAVATEAGLVVPVLRDADRLSLVEIDQGIETLAHKASEGRLTVDDLRGGTFTVTNGGVFGSLMSTPIVNPPQVAILGLHAVKDRPVVAEGAVVVRPMMYVALTYDHRVVDGDEAVGFLRDLVDGVAEPAMLLLTT